MTQIASPAKTRDGPVGGKERHKEAGIFYFISLGQISGQTKSDRDTKKQAQREDRGMSEEEGWCLP